MSHGDTIVNAPENFTLTASTEDVKWAAYKINGEKTWGVQFHPEVYHTEQGTALLSNFLDICGMKRDWTPASFIESTVRELKEELGDDKIILALSGGVDSSVTAVLLNRAIGKNLTCVFVDHGLLRKNEFETVLDDYEHLGLNVIGVDAKQHFYKELEGVTDPEEKRKIIGKKFIDVFEREAHKLKDIKWLAQGTIYPDIIRSDHGLLRKNEFETVLDDYEHLGLNVIGVDAKQHFYKELEGVTDPEEKRKIIGKKFIDVFEREAHKLKDIKWLAQGTIYPDII